MNIVSAEQMHATFLSTYKHAPDHITYTAGRVNLIGEHTDYNDGFVLPMAINMATWVAISKARDGMIHILPLNFVDQTHNLHIDEMQHHNPTDPSWLNYIKGCFTCLSAHTNRKLEPCNILIHGNIPIGAGLSSSASLELVILHALCELNTIEWQPLEMARLAQEIEHTWAHVNCGIMDQLVCALGSKDHALFIDCQNYAYQ